MKEKPLMTSFFAANVADTAITSVGLGLPGFQEVGILTEFDPNNIGNSMIMKFGVIAVLVGSYALAKKNKSHLEFSLEKTLQLGSVMVWGITAINTLQILPELMKAFNN